MAEDVRRHPRKWEIHETGGKVYLYAGPESMKALGERDRRNTMFSVNHEAAKPLSKADCLRLAKILLRYAG